MREAGAESKGRGPLVVVLVVALAGSLAVFATRYRVVRPLAGAGPPGPILLISLDNLRADRLGCYGYSRDTSPNLDALAARSLVFTDVHSPSNWTLPAHGSLLTGLRPREHGVIDHSFQLGDTPTLAEKLQEAGYSTAAFVSHANLSHRHGYRRGFDRWRIENDPPPEQWCREVVEFFREQCVSGDQDLAFCFLHLFTIHWPFEPSPPFDRKFDPDYQGAADGGPPWIQRFTAAIAPEERRDFEHVAALYDGEIATLDRALGEMFEALEADGLLARMTVVVTSDHGEALQEHGVFGHGFSMYQEELQVPLIIKLPERGGERGKRRDVDVPASLLDVAPTLLDLARAPALPGARGMNLLLPRKGGTRRRMLSESSLEHMSMRFDRVALRMDHLKYVFAPPVQRYAATYGEAVFDLAEDPGETRDLLGEQPALAAEFRRILSDSFDYEFVDGIALVWGEGVPLGTAIEIESDGRLVGVAPVRTRARRLAGGELESADPRVQSAAGGQAPGVHGAAGGVVVRASELGPLDPRVELGPGRWQLGTLPLLRYRGQSAAEPAGELDPATRQALIDLHYIEASDGDLAAAVRDAAEGPGHYLVSEIPGDLANGIFFRTEPPEVSVRIRVRIPESADPVLERVER